MKLIALLLTLTTYTAVNAQQNHKKKKNKITKTHVVKKTVVQQPLTQAIKHT